MAKKRKELTVEQLENLTRGHGKKYVSLDEGAALYLWWQSHWRLPTIKGFAPGLWNSLPEAWSRSYSSC